MADPKKLKLPPGATLVDDGSGMALPPGATLVSMGGTPTAQPPAPSSTPGFLSKAWNFVNKPLVSVDTSTQDKLLDDPSRYPSDFELKHPTLGGIASGLMGAGRDTGKLIESATTPLSLGTIGLGAAGKIPGAVGTIAKVGTAAAGAGFAAKGASDVIENAPKAAQGDPEAVQRALYGGASVVGGAAGALNSTKFANGKLTETPGRIAEAVRQKMLPGTPEQLLTRATKPNVGLPEYEASLTRSLPELAKRNPKSLNDLTAAADDIRNSTNSQYQGLMQQTKTPVDTRPVFDAQMQNIPATDVFEKPGIVASTATKADPYYRTNMPPQTADAIRVDTNAKLRGFFNKAGGDQAAALSDPETARVFAVNDTIRRQLYSTIQKATGENPAPIQQMYGDAVDVGDTAARRNTVFSRRQPAGLNEMVNNAGHPIAWIASKFIDSLNDNNKQVSRAFDRYKWQQNPAAPSRAVPGSIAAAIAQGRTR